MQLLRCLRLSVRSFVTRRNTGPATSAAWPASARPGLFKKASNLTIAHLREAQMRSEFCSQATGPFYLRSRMNSSSSRLTSSGRSR
jgi:hypothetical protein